MARTAQTARANKQTRQSCQQYFTDHAGNRALRYGHRNIYDETPTPWPPTDFAATPWFCFQVYLSVDLNLDEDAEAAASVAADSERALPNMSRCATLILYLCELFDLQIPQPLWEIYALPGASSLDFVEHSRRETMHRKQLRLARDVSVPLIPQVQAGMYAERNSAFLFVVDDDQGWHKVNDGRGEFHAPLKWPDKTGPLWVQFDPRLPTSVKTIDREWQMPCYKRGTDDIEFYSEQQDVKITRVQSREESFLNMRMMYLSSWKHDPEHNPNGEDKDDGMDFGSELSDELPPSELRKLVSTLKLGDAQAMLDSHNVMIEKGDDRIRLYNHKIDVFPDARYVVYVPFSHDNEQTLDATARTFTASFLSHLPDNETLDLHFHRPPIPTDTSILAHFTSLTLPSDSIGTLTTLQASRTFSDPPDYVRPREPHPRRLFPLDLQPHIFWNDPATFRREPYKTFIAIIDRPDFETSAAVRFLLVDGGPWRGDEMIRASDYCEIESWRAECMADVVRRLMLVQPQE